MSRKMKNSNIIWMNEIPYDWSTIKFKYLNKGMNTGEAVGKEYWSDEDNYIFYSAGLAPVKTNFKDFPVDKYTNETDILLSRNGTPYVFLPVSGALYSDHIIRVKMKEDTNKEFIRYCLQQSIMSVVVDSVSLATWSASLWNEQVLPWPNKNEQEKIVKFLNKKCSYINNIISKTQASIEEYKKLKQSIITQAVTKGVRGDREMKDSGVEWVGEIPAEWDVYRISSLYVERKEQGCEELPILTVSINSGVSDREFSDEEKERVFVRSEDRSKYMRVYPGDLTYNMMRAWQGAFGAVRVCGMVSPAYVIVKPKCEIDSRYMEALLRTQSAKEEMKRFSYGIADFRLRLYWDKFRNIKVCFPPIDEQREISDYIDLKCVKIDILITKKQQLLIELENYKKTMIYEYVTGKRTVA